MKETNSEAVRLQKYFSDCGVMSRRACEAEITAGHVTVNGHTAVLGEKIIPGADTVLLNDNPVLPRIEGYTYIVLNKPRGYVTTMSDEKGRKTVADIIAPIGKRLYPVGRLDCDSEGLLLMTDDGETANILTHPRNRIPKIYRVSVSGRVTVAMCEKLSKPVKSDGETLCADRISFLHGDKDHSVIEVELSEGKNREVRRICTASGLDVRRLCRTKVGEIELGGLPSGCCRDLTPKELSYIRGLAK